MIKRIKVIAVVTALVAMLAVPTVYAADTSTSAVEDYFKEFISYFLTGQDAASSSSSQFSFGKSGFQAEDGYLYHYTNFTRDVYPQGFVEIDGGYYHISEAGSKIDTYPQGFVTVNSVLCHLSADSASFDVYTAGFHVIDGKLCHVSQDGYAIDLYAAGPQEIDGSLYYSLGDGSFATDTAVGHLTFGSDGRYTSGNETLDQYVDEALAACTNESMTRSEKLRAAYLYVRDHGAYLARPHQARGSTSWAEESALFMFKNKKGNCYCFAGQFMYMARRLGFDAYVVSGGVGHRDADHAWVMIPEGSSNYIYDVELEWGYRVGKYGKADYNLYRMPLNKTVFSYQFP